MTPAGYRPRRCGRLACSYCGARITLSTVKAIELAAPTASGVLNIPASSLPPGTQAQLRLFATVLGDAARLLRADGLAWEYAWIVELSETGVPHVHFLQHGSKVSGRRFASAVRATSSGWGDLREIQHLARLARYVLKLPLAALDLDPDRPEDLLALHLTLNGGKLLHASRRFWRNAAGEPLPGIRAARVAARTVPKGPRPTQDQLSAWRAGWKLPEVPVGIGGSAGGALGLETLSAEGEGLGAHGSGPS